MSARSVCQRFSFVSACAILMPFLFVCGRPTGAQPSATSPGFSLPDAHQSNPLGAADSLYWRTRTSLLTPRANHGTAVVDGKIYVIGGKGGSGTSLATVEEYDPVTDSWMVRASLPTPRQQVHAAVSNGRIYAIGGWVGFWPSGAPSAVVEEYDPTTNSWRARANMPTARMWGGIATASNGRIYVIGGSDGIDALSTVEEYDSALDTWIPRANMPTARAYLSVAASSNGRLYAIGGNPTTWGAAYLATVEEYDPTTDTWRTRVGMPTARAWLGTTATSDGKIYAIGGWDNHTHLTTVEEYDPATNAWTAGTSMPTGRNALGAVAIHDRIYAIGGEGNTSPVLETVEEASPLEACIYTISGRVLDAHDHYIPGVSVSSSAGGITTPDANGDYILPGLCPGTHTLTPSKSGFTFSPLSLPVTVPPDATGQDFTGTPVTYSISGQITDGSGHPISSATISDGAGHTATTDGNGNYTLSGLAAGTYTITPSKGGYTFTPASRTVTAPPDATGQDFVGVGCNWDTLSSHPLLLVHGWRGPSSDRLVDDDQMGWFKYKMDGSNGDWLGASYQEGCNLFYATGVNGSNTLLDNARAIHGTIVRLVNVMQSNPNWNRRLDIIAHSYGGINSRAYLELYYPGDWGSYYDVDVRDLGIHVDNAFVLGSPLGGATGRELALPGSIYIGGSALVGGNLGSAWQLLAGQMEQFNQQNSQFDRFGQDRGTCYRLISGNMNEQSLPVAMPEPIKRYFSFFQNLPHDVGVSRRSAQVLAESRYQQTYPHIRREYTPDLHGYSTKWNLDTLRSLVHPGDTTAQLILPNIGAGLDRCTPRLTQVTGVEIVSDTGANDVPLVLLAANSITNSQVITGGFDVSWGGSSLLMLKWMDGDLNLTLRDPTGQVISPTQVPADNVVYSRVDFDLSQMASYAFTNTLGGSWSYTITASGLPYTMPFSLMALPDSMIAIRASVPEWNPFASAVPITAEVTYSTTTLIPGAVVSVTLARPDGVEDTLLLLDDGAHGDGLAGDGIYGNSYASTLSGFYAASVSASGVYSGEVYRRSASIPFAMGSSGAQFSGHYRDFPSAPNLLGLSDVLNVEVGITVTTVASYTLSADLVASNGVFIAQAKAATPASTGTQTVTLAFGGEAIRTSGLNGPYTVTQLNLSRASGGLALKLEELADAWTTAAYDYRQFGQLPRYFGSEKRSAKAVVTTGDVLTYTMLIRNPGDANLFGVVVTDVIPIGTTYVTGSARASSGVITDIGGIRWSGVVSANGTITLTLCVTATALAGTAITNTASISDDNLPEPIIVSTTTAVHAPTPVAVADLAASRSGTDIVLTWSHTDVVVDHYEVWRSTDPYFVPGEAGSEKRRDVSPPPLGNEASIIDVGALVQADVNYFYRVKAVNVTGEWAVSNRVGVFSFTLTPGGD
ncbi:MAG: DUF11 domain-containing protein [Planctomycetes bacterium]|nr:DUF11 domain-containing protein [Planctomycetota bacterium]